ncbi:hypothetical protein KFU94_38815 [Chloroflexi bacterium TSY]|nr:hypothetical protein [Chloroflexi bacterium TSY]
MSGLSTAKMIETISGRLRRKVLGSCNKNMILRLEESEGIETTEEFALAIWALAQDYPYAIESLLQTSCPAKKKYPDLDALYCGCDENRNSDICHPN